ncbi:MAG TPA: hypothetical protein VJ852_02865 [Gemmatimonadaceae bacterium]|nr:hypothetical protein [Gemmatimonadaceae bacterium]
MNQKGTLIFTSTLSAVLFILHWADEIARGLEPGTINAAGGIAILVVWLSGPLVLGARRSGYVLMLITGILGLGILLLHMTGRGLVGGRIANTSGQFFWVTTAIMLGVSSSLAAILAAIELWRSLRRRNRPL